jgi:hypothetical protein
MHPNLILAQLSRSVGIGHGRVVDVCPLSGQGRFDRQGLHIDVGLTVEPRHPRWLPTQVFVIICTIASMTKLPVLPVPWRRRVLASLRLTASWRTITCLCRVPVPAEGRVPVPAEGRVPP